MDCRWDLTIYNWVYDACFPWMQVLLCNIYRNELGLICCSSVSLDIILLHSWLSVQIHYCILGVIDNKSCSVWKSLLILIESLIYVRQVRVWHVLALTVQLESDRPVSAHYLDIAEDNRKVCDKAFSSLIVMDLYLSFSEHLVSFFVAIDPNVPEFILLINIEEEWRALEIRLSW